MSSGTFSSGNDIFSAITLTPNWEGLITSKPGSRLHPCNYIVRSCYTRLSCAKACALHLSGEVGRISGRSARQYLN